MISRNSNKIGAVHLFFAVFKTTWPPQTKFTAMSVAMDCRHSNKKFTWIRLISIQSLLKLPFVVTDWLKLIWKAIFLNKTLKMLRSCLIDGSPLRIARRDRVVLKTAVIWPLLVLQANFFNGPIFRFVLNGFTFEQYSNRIIVLSFVTGELTC